MAFDPLTAAFSIGEKVIDKIFPDKDEANKAKLRLMEIQQAGGLKELEIQVSVLLAEAKSADPWTSRARPSFLYVVYVMILSSIPLGVLSIFNPEAATQISAAMKSSLGAIPGELWTTFTIGYTGYTLSRSFGDKRAIENMKK